MYCRFSNDEGTVSLLHCLQLMTTQDTGVAAIVDQVESVTDILIEFLLKICEDEIVNLEGLICNTNRFSC
mgnify:FL=1